MRCIRAVVVSAAVVAVTAHPATAADEIVLGEAVLERPTTVAVGVRLPFSGDDDEDARAELRYRAAGSAVWREALPPFRVRPEVVRRPPGEAAAVHEFAGSVFGLRAGRAYELELKVTEPDGQVDRTFSFTTETRPVPAGPSSARVRRVKNGGALRAALADAQPGDVIELAPGVYRGTFVAEESGTLERPVVIRGASARRTVLDGRGCDDCNVLDVYGSFVHVERLTIRNAFRGLKFQGEDSVGNAVRRLRIVETTLGIGMRAPQRDFYICDNRLRGRLRWPHVYSDDGGEHSDDEGIVAWGEGHVVCHNRVAGYGDALNVGPGDRSSDFYGNEVTSSYDNAVELDGGHGNLRFYANRVTNAYAPLSAQPVSGGPAYFVRNVVVNTADEQLKFKAVGEGPGAREPSGMLVYNNTFVSSNAALLLQTPATAHWFEVRNNIFFGPDPGTSPWWPDAVHWTGRIDRGTFESNGYYPNGRFVLGGDRFANFAALRAAGFERDGVLLGRRTFRSLRPLRGYRRWRRPRSSTLARRNRAIDAGSVLPGVTDGFRGRAPDLGATERGARRPRYGPR